jgi:hypothetical protein
MYIMVTSFPANSRLCIGDSEITGGVAREGSAIKKKNPPPHMFNPYLLWYLQYDSPVAEPKSKLKLFRIVCQR